MKNTFKNKSILLFLGLGFCFLVCPYAYGTCDDTQLECKTDIKCDDSQNETKKIEELEKILSEWSEYSKKHPEDVDEQYEFYKKALEIAKEIGIVE